MLKILDQYIIKKYLTTFFFVGLMFSMIAVVIDFSEKVEEFIKKSVTTKEIIVDYYMTFIPFINGLLWPLFAMIAVIFFTSRLANNSEIISILNAGVSFKRLLQPYMIAAGIIIACHLLANHIGIPKGNKIRLDFEHRYTDTYADKGKTKDLHMFIAPDTKVYIRFYSKGDTSARDFRLEKFKDGELVYLLKAKRAKWKGEPNKWQLQNYEIRTFEGMKETFIQKKNEKMDTIFNLYPDDFVRYHNQKEMMTTAELQDFIDMERQRGLSPTKVYEIEIHRRTAEPFTILILTLIGVALASKKIRGGMGLHLAIGMAIGAVYIFLSKFSITFATNKSLSPLLGVWIPNIIFSIVAIYLLLRAQK